MSSKNPPHVYCVMPVFNRIDATLECVGCLKKQSYKALTIIAVDGGSTDGTLARLKHDCPEVELLEGRDLWWGGATHLGIEWALANSKSDDDFVMLVNNDTTFDERYVETILQHCKTSGGAFCGVVVDIDEPDRVIDGGVNLDWEKYRFDGLYEIPADLQPKLDSCVLPGRGTVIPVSAIRKSGNIDHARFPHYLSDYEFTYRLRTRSKIPLGVVYDAVIRTSMEPPNQVASSRWHELKRALSEISSRRSKRNVFDHYRFIDSHAPGHLKSELKRLLFRRHFNRINRLAFGPAIGLVGVARRQIRAMGRRILHQSLVHRTGRLLFGHYLIAEDDIQLLKLDRNRLLAMEIIAETRHPGFYFAGRSKQYVASQYPEALALYRRSLNPFRKIARLIRSRRSRPTSTKTQTKEML